jgi:hypothetical protein
VSGVLGARFSPSVLLAGGLMATALINIAFGFGTSLAWFCFFWALNGTLQVRPGSACVCLTWGDSCGMGGHCDASGQRVRVRSAALQPPVLCRPAAESTMHCSVGVCLCCL